MELQFRARDFRRIARDKLRGKWWLSVAVSLVAGLLGAWGGSISAPNAANTGYSFSQGGATSGTLPELGGEAAEALDEVMSWLSQILANPFIMGILITAATVSMFIGIGLFLVGAPTLLGHNDYYIKLCNNEEPAFGVLFSRFKYFWKAVGLRAFMALFIFLWTLLLIVPGIIAGYRYAMAPYLMAQNPDMGIREAVDESKRLMYGHKGRLFCLNLSFIGWSLLCVFTFGIGNLFLTPYVQAANAAFYLDRTGQGIPLNPSAA